MRTSIRFLIVTGLMTSFAWEPGISFAARTSREASQQTWELCDAAWEGEIQEIKDLIAEGANVNGKDVEGDTALHIAVMRNRTDIAELLIANAADLNAKSEASDSKFSMRSPTASTPLQIAVFEGYLEMAKLLLAKGADANAKADNGNTALHYAVFAGHKAVVELLLANGSDLDVKGRDELTPLEVAVKRSHEEIAKLLVTEGTEVTIHLAAFIGDLPRLKTLIEAGTAPDANDKDGMRPLHYAATGGNRDAVELLIARGADVNARVPQLLSDVDEELEAELRSGASQDAKASGDNEVGFTPLHFAAVDGYLDVTELLVDKGAKVDAKGPHHFYPFGDEPAPNNTPLFFAACNGHSDVVDLLASRGSDVNTKGSPLSGDSPYWAIGPAQYQPGPALIWAINRGHVKTAEVLIAHGADVHARESLAGWGRCRWPPRLATPRPQSCS